jgi:hypothetical protein
MEPECSLPSSRESTIVLYPELDSSSPHYPILSLLRSILILSFHLRLGLPSGCSLLAFQPNSYKNSTSYPRVLHAFPIPCSLTYHSNYTWRRIYIIKIRIIRFSRGTYFVIPLGSKRFLQRHVLKCSRSLFLLWRRRTWSTPIQN